MHRPPEPSPDEILEELPLAIANTPVPDWVSQFANESLKQAKKISCFDFVPSSFSMVYRLLDSLPRARWCEWGSGAGINTAIAASLGFEATGIELDARLAELSRTLFKQSGFQATILEGSYFEIDVPADFYYVYCWPGQVNQVEAHFVATAPSTARLLICNGAEDVRCKARRLTDRRISEAIPG